MTDIITQKFLAVAYNIYSFVTFTLNVLCIMIQNLYRIYINLLFKTFRVKENARLIDVILYSSQAL